MKRLIALLILISIGFSCKKNDPKPADSPAAIAKSNLSGSKGRIWTNITLKIDGVESTLSDCDVDYSMLYKSDGTFIETFPADCGLDFTTASGTWDVNTDGTLLTNNYLKNTSGFYNTKETWTIISISSTACTIKYKHTDGKTYEYAQSGNDDTNSNPSSTTPGLGSSDPYGIWQRYDSPKGYQTDLAVGGITGEPSNRVYMCEHSPSPSEGFYKGYITGNIITWDAVHGLPNAEFKPNGGAMTLYFGVGSISDAGKYKKGIWTKTCGELKKSSIFFRWTEDSQCSPISYSESYKYPNLPSNLSENKDYGPIAAGTVEVVLNHNGSSSSYYFTLTEPPAGYNRYYTSTTWKFNSSVNRCNFTRGSSLTYVDKLQ